MLNRFYLYAFLVTVFFARSLAAQDNNFLKLSDEAIFSLITCTPGTDLYNQFGHSAIRLSDKKLGLDFVYNYGTFDFDTPNFAMKFIERKLMYTLSKSSFRPFLNSYVHEGRGVAEQRLELDSAARQKLFETLETNYLPQNRAYLYDFFYDNCATKIRDVIASIGNLKIEDSNNKKTFRAYLHEYIKPNPWLNFGIDLILGIEADLSCNSKMQMFLPDYLSVNLESAKLNNDKLMSDIVWILPKPDKKTSQTGFTPLMLNGAIFLIALVLFLVKNQRALVIFEITFLALVFLAGLFLLFMWFGTDHIATQKNLNVLWANPLYIFWIFTAYRNKMSTFARYNGYVLLFSNSIVFLMFLLPFQQFNPAILPLVLLTTLAICRALFINTFKK